MSDLISRQAAIDALDEQIEQCDKSLSSFGISLKDAYAVKVERASLVAFREILEYLPTIQPVNCSKFPNNSDTISRQAAIDAIHCNITVTGRQNAELVATTIGAFADRIKALPPAQPERIKGHWIEHDDGLTACECSVCHEKYALYEEDVFGRNFCPKCGAEMEVTT